MAKFDAYTALAAASVAAGDLFLVDDISVPQTKKVTAATALQAILGVSTGDVILASHVLSIGPNGATGPSLQVDGSTGSAAAGLKVTGAASGSGVALAAIGGTNEPVTLNAKGSGAVTIGAVSTGDVVLGTTAKTLTVANASGLVTIAASGLTVTSGNLILTSGNATLTSGNLTLTSGNLLLSSGTFTQTGNAAITGTITGTSASASALAVGRQGATSPALQVDASTSTCVTGLKAKAAASGAGYAVSVVGGATDEGLTVDAKGAGIVQIGGTSTGNVKLGGGGGVVVLPGTLTAGGLLTCAAQVATSGPLIYSGSGAPSISAAVKGSLYLRSDGSTTNDRIYVAKDNAGTWAALTSAS